MHNKVAGTTFLVGNPFMTHLSISQFTIRPLLLLKCMMVIPIILLSKLMGNTRTLYYCSLTQAPGSGGLVVQLLHLRHVPSVQDVLHCLTLVYQRLWSHDAPGQKFSGGTLTQVSDEPVL